MADYDARFNRLVLSAADLKNLTSGQKPGEPWPDALVEDYLNILRDLVELLDLIESNAAEIINNNLQIRQLQSHDAARIAKLYGKFGDILKTISDLANEIASKQEKLLWQDEGVDLAPLGDVDTIDFTGAGVTATYLGGVVTVNIPGGGGGSSMSEVEIDFGTTPVQGKKFTIVDAAIAPTSKIIVSPSGNIGTGRVGDDWEWDSIAFAAKPGAGSFDLTAYASGRIVGNRKIFYSVG